MDVGRLLGPFWEPKRHQKMNEILDAFLEAKKRVRQIFEGRPGGMRGALGRIMEGYENEFWQRIEAENKGRGKEPRLRYLARRPRWGGGSFRAFRWAEAARMCDIPKYLSGLFAGLMRDWSLWGLLESCCFRVILGAT